MATGMAGSGDDFEPGSGLHSRRSPDENFSVRLSPLVLLMDDPLAFEFFGVFRGVGHVVLVGQKNIPDPAQFGEPADQVGKKFGGIHEPIAFGALHEITVSPEGL